MDLISPTHQAIWKVVCDHMGPSLDTYSLGKLRSAISKAVHVSEDAIELVTDPDFGGLEANVLVRGTRYSCFVGSGGRVMA